MRESPMRYPLDWPPEQPRTPAPSVRWGPYKVSQDTAQRDLMHELELLGARSVVLSTNLRIRRDGLPYASQRSPDDPGVAVYWTRGGQDFCVACDAYRDIRSNMRAAGLAIHHLRRLEQAAPSFAERAFSGFARLPATAGGDGERPWRDVLDFGDEDDVAAEDIEAAFRRLARQRHPDRGGSAAAMAELNRARREGLRRVGACG